MSDDLKEFMHEWFRRIDAKLDQAIELLVGFGQRPSLVEPQQASLRAEVAHLRGDFVRLEHRVDRLDARVARIEKRLDLFEA